MKSNNIVLNQFQEQIWNCLCKQTSRPIRDYLIDEVSDEVTTQVWIGIWVRICDPLTGISSV